MITPPLHYAAAPYARPFSRFAIAAFSASVWIVLAPWIDMQVASSTEPYWLHELLFRSERSMYLALFSLPLLCLAISAIAHARIAQPSAIKRGRGLTIAAMILSICNMGLGFCAGELIKGIGC